MKIKTALASLAVIAIAGLSHAAEAKTHMRSVEWTSYSGVNLRAGPGTNFPVVATLPKNAILNIGGCLQDFSWCQVRNNNAQGWVSGRYVCTFDGRHFIRIYDSGPAYAVPVIVYRRGHDNSRIDWNDRDNHQWRDRDWDRDDDRRGDYDRDNDHDNWERHRR